MTTPYSINITHYDNSTCFFAQINERFYDFDVVYDEFQRYCDSAPRIQHAQLKTDANLSSLAIAARFDDDNVWYRARISIQSAANSDFLQFKNSDASAKILIEFVDYGNTQLTSMENCVYLNEKLATYKQCAVKCHGMPYLASIAEASRGKLDAKSIENLLFYGRLTVAEEGKFDWTRAFFVTLNNLIYLEIDELYRLFFKLNLVETAYYFSPSDYSEAILRQANQDEIERKVKTEMSSEKTISIEAVASNLDAGLKYMYFHPAQCMTELRSLESELAAEIVDTLAPLQHADLVANRFYLARYQGFFYRVLLLAQKSKKCPVRCQLIDYGARVWPKGEESSLEFFVLTPKYFKYRALAFHCRLVLAYTIENVWTSDEKKKFYEEIKVKRMYQIKLRTFSEPYIIEFQEADKINFGFGPIIGRISQNEGMQLEPRTVLMGNRVATLNEEFSFGGDLLKGSSIESNYLLA